MPFYLFVFVVGAEYIGLGSYIPAYKALPIAFFISFMLTLYVIYKNTVSELLEHKAVKYYLLFMFLTSLGLLHGLIQSYAINPLKMQIGYFMFTIIAFYLINNQKKIHIFTMMFIFFHVFIILMNFEKFSQTTRTGYFVAGFFVGDGNDLAWSINVALPLSLFLVFTTKNTIMKSVYTGMALLLLLGIVGTQSRGAFLSLVAGLLYYFMYITTKRWSGVVLIMIVSIGVLTLAPSNYFSRMETITTYEQDTSAMGRIKAWKTAVEMGIDHPVLGVGAGSFNSAYGRYYRKPTDPVRWISTHSVYFKVLGEYGFLGLFIYAMIIFQTIKTNSHTVRLIQNNPGVVNLHVLWPKCLNWSIVSWSVAAMFLSGVDYPHLFLLLGLSMGASRIVKNDLRKISDCGVTENNNKYWFEDKNRLEDVGNSKWSH